ncbi:hypothetical protein Pint_29954 [Pistacia integerrima]|uniref:Uncharacterized protein n=1 Tax=Pistacia integerrima TaxID=434235 RepID=A0ACC0WZQ2_9ROSI|nr:hypothetical protein Pint_29954 [Pistacia integerrima]
MKSRLALEEYGCFVASYHKLSSEFRENVFDVLKELFQLPEETKMKNVNPNPGHGCLKLPNLPRYEGLAIEFATNKEACKNFTNVLWPKGNDRFCEIAHTVANMIAELQQLVMRMLFESYGIDEMHHESQRRSTTYLLRFLNYRKCMS